MYVMGGYRVCVTSDLVMANNDIEVCVWMMGTGRMG